MPGYAGTGQAQLLRENQQISLFQQELVIGVASIAIQLERNRSTYPLGVSFQIYFTDVNGNPATPGVFEVDIQSSDVDQDSQYGIAGALTAVTGGGLNANSVGRIEFLAIYARYVRAFVKTRTNPVYTTVLATH